MGNGRKSIRVLLVDDHPVVRKGLGMLIEREMDMTICAEAESATDALSAVSEHEPDLVVMDISLKNSNGLGLLKDLHIRAPKLPVLVLSIHDEAVYAERVIRAGARGYIMKQEATDRVLAAIRRVLQGEVYLSEKAQSRMFDLSRRSQVKGATPIGLLSDRELEIFELTGQGLGTRRIAEQLNVSIKTIESHVARIKEKLGIKSHTELVQQAILWLSNEHRG